MLTRARGQGVSSERGAAMVMFAILLPLILAFGSLVMTVGNWWVHKRHLQTQVDAAVFAGGTEFWACSATFGQQATANKTIKARALEYAGDSLRPPSSIDPTFTSTVRNPQVQEPNDVRVVLNSPTWWSQGNPTDGTGYDDQWDPDGDPGTPGDPCTTRSLDAKATDDESPTLWGWLPFVASPKTKARVEIRQVVEMSGLLPFAVPEVDPVAVSAIFVREDTGAIVGWQALGKDLSYDNDGNAATPFPFSAWTTYGGQETMDIPTENTSVVILVSREDTDPMDQSPPHPNTLAGYCGQAPGLVKCYAGTGATSGATFIHGWSDIPGNPANPQIRDVSLYSTCSDLSQPYFLANGDCDVGATAKIDFGVPGNPVPNPPAGIEARVWLHASANCGGSGDVMAWQGTLGTVSEWRGGSKTLVAASGRNPLSIEWRMDDGPGPPVTDCFDLVAAPYVADDASGPLEYLKIWDIDQAPYPLVVDGNSRNQGPDHWIKVTVGLNKPLAIEPPLNPPFLLRFASKSGSLNQALDCDSGITFKDEIADGCRTRYRLNYYDWDGDGPGGTPYTWDDILCTAYPSPSDLPPPTFIPPPGQNAPNCVAAKTGDVVSMRQGLFERFHSNPDPAADNGCWPNNWPAIAADIPDWIENHGPQNDPRYVTLVITDFTAFSGSGAENVPVKYFGGFYATGWDVGPAGGGNQTGCPSENDPHPLGLSSTRDNGDVWGHFVNIVVPQEADPSDTLCNFDEIGTCVAVLVE